MTIRCCLKHTSRAVPLSASWLRGRPRGSRTTSAELFELEITEITGPTPRHALMQILRPPRKSCGFNGFLNWFLNGFKPASGNWRNWRNVWTLALGSQSFPQFDEMNWKISHTYRGSLNLGLGLLAISHHTGSALFSYSVSLGSFRHLGSSWHLLDAEYIFHEYYINDINLPPLVLNNC